MQLDIEQVDSIVKRVLAQLKSLGLSDAPSETEPKVIRKSILSVDDIDSHTTELVISHSTIVTPLAKDEIRDRNITLSRLPFDSTHSKTCTNKNQDEGLFEDCKSSRLSAEHVNEMVLETVANCGVATLSTYRPHKMVCLLNRFSNLRAACVAGEACIDGAIDQLDPNVWIVNSGMPHPKVRQLIGLIRKKSGNTK